MFPSSGVPVLVAGVDGMLKVLFLLPTLAVARLLALGSRIVFGLALLLRLLLPGPRRARL